MNVHSIDIIVRYNYKSIWERGDTVEIELSVRELVSFVMRRGSIDRPVASYERLQLGGRLHRSYQQRQTPPYLPEVSISRNVEYRDIIFSLTGRADGVIEDGDFVAIEEIKTTKRAVNKLLPADFPEYLAQAELYAYMYAKNKALTKIITRITFINTDTEEAKSHDFAFSISELEGRVFDILEKYYPFALLRAEGLRDFITSAKKLKFPFHDYRLGQQDIILDVFRTLRAGGRLFAEAPTGLGKTLSVCYGAVKAVGEGSGRRIFYLTPKSTVSEAPDSAFSLMREHGLKFRKIKLISKERSCLCRDALGDCSSDICPYSRGHYDRVRDALLALLCGHDDITPEIIVKTAREKSVCPHELMLDAALWCDVVICDCNYLFDPAVYLRRFFDDIEGAKASVAVIDEAHDLIDRAREMYSAQISLADFEKLLAYIPKSDFILYFPLVSLCDEFRTLAKRCRENEGFVGDEEYGTLLSEDSFYNLEDAADEFFKAAMKWLAVNADSGNEVFVDGRSLTSRIRDAAFLAKGYRDASRAADGKFLHFAAREGSKVTASVLCIDPSGRIDERLSRVGSAILFSATLTPMEYYCDLLGGKDAGQLSLPSPFDRENLFCGIMHKISTRYADRDRTVTAVVDIIERTVSARRGNYLVFLPSYEMLGRVVHAYTRITKKQNILCQKPNMTLAERDNFLKAFSEDGNVVGFAVLGGMFSESIDLVGDKLIGTIIVGTGLARLNIETNIIADYFAKTREAGFEYAYLYPAINKVLQAIGRVIRSEYDRGVCILIDDRYATPQYSRLLCRSVKGVRLIENTNALTSALREFWEEK